ncbi:MAG: glycosyltransferase [bacterium]|nr:glycosyltransferase [bacterium]
MKLFGTHKNIAIVVTVMNEAHTIIGLLDCLRQQSFIAKEIIVTDGGSSDQTLSLLKTYQKDHPHFPVEVITIKGNRSVGRNAAIEAVKSQLIAVTDAGCYPRTDWLAELAQEYDSVAKRHPKKSIVIAGYYEGLATTPFEAAVVPYVLVMPEAVDEKSFLPATRSVLFDKAAWAAVGGFNEQLQINEDYYFARQLVANHQIQLGFARQAIVGWVPRHTLSEFTQMIYSYAKGDTAARMFRPKVGLIFVRYLLGIGVVTGLLVTGSTVAALLLIAVGLMLYSIWAIKKNYRSAAAGWYYLPILQIVSDFAVMTGSVAGLLFKQSQR